MSPAQRAALAGAVMVVAVVLVAILAAPAHALMGTPAIDGNKTDVARYINQGGTAPPGPATCPATCSDLWLSEHRPMPNQTSSAKLHRELWRLRFRAGVGTAFRFLGGVGAAATAFTIGWKIGEGLRAKYVEGNMTVTVPAGNIATLSYNPADEGQLLGNHWLGQFLQPFDGWQVVANGLESYRNELSQHQACGENNAQDAPSGTPGTPWPPFTEWTCVIDGAPQKLSTYYMLYAPPSSPEMTLSPPTEWTGQTADVNRTVGGPGSSPSEAQIEATVEDELTAHPEAYPTLIPWLDFELGGPSLDPTANYTTVPDCDGLLWSACEAELDLAGLEGARVVLDFNGADVTKPADAVISLNPAAGATVEEGSTVTVTTNPGPEAMPVLVPAPNPGETYAAYITRLQNLGLVGSAQEATENTGDPQKGPEEVSYTNPQQGTRVMPGTTITVVYNPTTWPGPVSAPAITPLNLDPLADVNLGCSTFPFGVFCWFADGLTSWDVAGGCPSFTVPFVYGDLLVDFCLFEPAMQVIRPVIVVLVLFGLAWFFAATAFSFSANEGRD